MKKNGFTLMEVAVTVGIVVLLGIAIASTCLIATSNTNNTRIINFAINEVQNVQKLFEKAELVNSGDISYSALETNILSYYSNEVEVKKQDNNMILNLYFESDYSIKVNAPNCVIITFSYSNHNVVMGAVVNQKENELYNNNNLFTRWVEV